jgi:zinc finger HIT domain-containing protein 1
MPHVEVLPNSTATVAPGWTYVVDTGYDPSKVAINPKNKKRAAAAAPSGQRGENELSARQQTAIARRIAELERDNDPKQTITIPGKPSVPKTQNARRIIQYQRQIKHWLDDEEAQMGQAATTSRGSVSQAGRGAAQALRRQSTFASVPATPHEATTGPSAITQTPSRLDNAFADDALLSIDQSMPSPLKSADLEALLAAPPLSYAASHAAPPAASGPPQRQFCDNCGYWGQIKCRKCGARVCGLECKDAHEATRCLKWA